MIHFQHYLTHRYERFNLVCCVNFDAPLARDSAIFAQNPNTSAAGYHFTRIERFGNFLLTPTAWSVDLIKNNLKRTESNQRMKLVAGIISLLATAFLGLAGFACKMFGESRNPCGANLKTARFEHLAITEMNENFKTKYTSYHNSIPAKLFSQDYTPKNASEILFRDYFSKTKETLLCVLHIRTIAVVKRELTVQEQQRNRDWVAQNLTDYESDWKLLLGNICSVLAEAREISPSEVHLLENQVPSFAESILDTARKKAVKMLLDEQCLQRLNLVKTKRKIMEAAHRFNLGVTGFTGSTSSAG